LILKNIPKDENNINPTNTIATTALTLISFNLQGQPVQLEGLGTYTPTIDLDGTVGVGHRADMEIKKHLNIPGEFKGEIENRENAFFASLKRMARPATNWSPGGTWNTRAIRSRSRPDRAPSLVDGWLGRGTTTDCTDYTDLIDGERG